MHKYREGLDCLATEPVMDAIEELNTVTESNMILEEIEKVSRKVKENAGK